MILLAFFTCFHLAIKENRRIFTSINSMIYEQFVTILFLYRFHSKLTMLKKNFDRNRSNAVWSDGKFFAIGTNQRELWKEIDQMEKWPIGQINSTKSTKCFVLSRINLTKHMHEYTSKRKKNFNNSCLSMIYHLYGAMCDMW